MADPDILSQVPDGWTRTDDDTAIERTFTFDGFPAAIAFMAGMVDQIETANHHPEWRNVYNRVEVRLTTHDTGGLTARDIALAHSLDSAAADGAA